MPFKRPERRVIFAPRAGRQFRLETDVLQELFRVEAIFGGNAGQQQTARTAARDLQSVLADLHRADARCAARRDGLLIRKQPHFHIEMFQRGIETAIVYLDELAQLAR